MNFVLVLSLYLSDWQFQAPKYGPVYFVKHILSFLCFFLPSRSQKIDPVHYFPQLPVVFLICIFWHLAQGEKHSLWGKVSKKAVPERIHHRAIFTAAKCNVLLKMKEITWQKVTVFLKEEKNGRYKKMHVNQQPRFKDSQI